MRVALAFVLVALSLPSPGEAAPTETLSFQGQLLDASGAPLPGPESIGISLSDAAEGGTLLYGELHEGVLLRNGVFQIQIGQGLPVGGLVGAVFPGFVPEIFDAPEIWVGVELLDPAGNPELFTPRVQVTSSAFALRSLESVDSMSLRGLAPDDLRITSFSEIPDQLAESQVPVSIARTATVQDLSLRVDVLETAGGDLAALQAQVVALQAVVDALVAKLEGIDRAGDTLVFEGVNVQIVNGLGQTDATNGLGNLIVGYNEPPITAPQRSGSHTVIVGPGHEWTSTGGLVTGEFNTVSGRGAAAVAGTANVAGATRSAVMAGAGNNATGIGASVSGGSSNVASGQFATVTGGSFNEASGGDSSVGGGVSNRAEGVWAVVSGGASNQAEAERSVVSGGLLNRTTGVLSVLQGGEENVASGTLSTIGGGMRNRASGSHAGVSGGEANRATGTAAMVLGGGGVDEGNHAFADHSAVLGGRYNLAGDSTSSDRSQGRAAVVVGGFLNWATGDASTVVGGQANLARAEFSSVAGGSVNRADGKGSIVVGGNANTLSGLGSVVVGGQNNDASGNFAVVTGGLGNEAGGIRSVVSGGFERSVSTNLDWRAGDLFEDD